MNLENIAIEHNIPLPARGGRYGGSAWNPILHRMKPGDSFVVERSQIAGLRAAATRIKIVVRIHMVSETLARCWRDERSPAQD